MSTSIYRELHWLSLDQRCSVASHRAGRHHTVAFAPALAYIAALEAEMADLGVEGAELYSARYEDENGFSSEAHALELRLDMLGYVADMARDSIGVRNVELGPWPWTESLSRCESCGCTAYSHCRCQWGDDPF